MVLIEVMWEINEFILVRFGNIFVKGRFGGLRSRVDFLGFWLMLGIFNIFWVSIVEEIEDLGLKILYWLKEGFVLLLELGVFLLFFFFLLTFDKEFCLEVIVVVDVVSFLGKKFKGFRYGLMNGWEIVLRLELMLIILGEMDVDIVKFLLRDVEEGIEMVGIMVEGIDVLCDVDDGVDMEDDNGRSILGDLKVIGYILVIVYCLYVIVFDEVIVICFVVFVLIEVKVIIGNLIYGVEMCFLDLIFMIIFFKFTRDLFVEFLLGINGLVIVFVREGGVGLLVCNWFNVVSVRRVIFIFVWFLFGVFWRRFFVIDNFFCSLWGIWGVMVKFVKVVFGGGLFCLGCFFDSWLDEMGILSFCLLIIERICGVEGCIINFWVFVRIVEFNIIGFLVLVIEIICCVEVGIVIFWIVLIKGIWVDEVRIKGFWVLIIEGIWVVDVSIIGFGRFDIERIWVDEVGKIGFLLIFIVGKVVDDIGVWGFWLFLIDWLFDIIWFDNDVFVVSEIVLLLLVFRFLRVLFVIWICIIFLLFKFFISWLLFLMM